MTVEEIFNKIASHMVDGIAYHEELIKGYSFLNLWGYVKCQEYHYYEEARNYKQLEHYYMTHYHKLLQITSEKKNPIPATWYKYSMQSVDVGTKRNGIKELLTKWIEWEKETKKLYEEMYSELTNLKEAAATIELQKYIQDVDEELSIAQKEQLNLESIGYNLDVIIDWQDDIRKKYKKKIKNIF